MFCSNLSFIVEKKDVHFIWNKAGHILNFLYLEILRIYFNELEIICFQLGKYNFEPTENSVRAAVFIITFILLYVDVNIYTNYMIASSGI